MRLKANHRQKCIFLHLLSLGIAFVAFQNCSKVAVSNINPHEKLATLEDFPVFADPASKNPDIGTVGLDPQSPPPPSTPEQIEMPVPEQEAPPAPEQVAASSSGPSWPTTASVPNAQPDSSDILDLPISGSGTGVSPSSPSVQIQFGYLCSNDETFKRKGNILTAEKINAQIISPDGNVVCEVGNDLRSQILNTKSAQLTLCPSLQPGRYLVNIVNSSSQQSLNDTSSAANQSLKDKSASGIYIQVDQNGIATVEDPHAKYLLLYDVNWGTSFSPAMENLFADLGIIPESFHGSANLDGGLDSCDSLASPLIVSLPDSPEASSAIELSAPLDGIRFDILGARSFPMAHNPKPISWFKNPSHSAYFITLPDQNGEVHGIDQLFGNNTQGPDHGFARDGYNALAKYDLNKDGIITEADPVFHAIRLWRDSNLDGIAQPSELFSLEEKKLVAIDLHFDSGFREVDAYGNETRMKSVVQSEDGKLHLMFDLWFRYINR